MGAYDGNPRNELAYNTENRSQWNPSMERNLADKFSGLGVNESSKDNSLVQVMKAVEAAESTIKNQAEENNRLRAELQKRTLELERYQKSDDSTTQSSHAAGLRDDHIRGAYTAHQSVSPAGNQEDRLRWRDVDPQGTLVLHQNLIPGNSNSPLYNRGVGPHYAENNNVNGALKLFPGGHAAGDDPHSSPSPRSRSPSRYRREAEYDPKNVLSGHGLMPVSEVDNQSNIWKQDLVVKVREHEEEILQLRKHLAEYSMKEAQIRNEKYVMEKRIAYMRMAFDQQQQDLVEAASKSLSYRQDIIEENVRLTYALQAAQQERSTFVSSLLPLLVEYSLQPPVLDAQSIVSNLKVLFKHLQEKLLVTEEKLKESQYQISPWHSDLLNYPSTQPQSPSPPIGAALTISNKMGLELVPQPAYSVGHTSIPITSNVQTTMDERSLGQHNHHAGLVGLATTNMEPDNMGRSSPSSRNPAVQDATYQFASSSGDSHGKHFSGETTPKQPSFTNQPSGSEMDDPDAAGNQNWKDPSALWGTGNSPYLTPTHDDQNSSFSPYLPPVLEEPSSSFSEAGEDDPLPAIDGLQISGEAFPGRELQASGYSINGTTSCNFEWVRHLEDGSVKYIEGAKQPTYLITADDVDTYLAIEVQPLDNRKRTGELVRVFANEQRKITCDSEMQEQIEKTLYSGHASYEVFLSAGYLDIWEPAILAIKKEGYSIKCIGPRGVVVTEKFLPTTNVAITYGHPTAFSIYSTGEHILRTSDSTLRDTIVLTMRLFIIKAGEKKKGKKKGLFFNK